MKPEPGSLSVNRVTTFDNGDVIGGEQTHEHRPIGIYQRGIPCRGEQLHRYGTFLHQSLEVPPIRPQ
jgi:hypothetical protein